LEETSTKSVGRFTLKRLLNSKGIAEVYVAHDPDLDCDVVLKLPRFASASVPWVERYRDRILAISDLQHTNICSVFGLGEANGVSYVSMEYAEGPTLAEFAGKGLVIEPRQVALLIGKLALAVDQMHGVGIIHGSLAPSSIVVKPCGEPVIVEFGLNSFPISAEFDSAADADQEYAMRRFSAPEVRSSEGGDASTGSDIYSLAAIGMLMLSGEVPDSADQAMLALTPAGCDHEHFDSVRNVFVRAMATDAGERFGSAREFAISLDRLYRTIPRAPIGETVAATTDTPNSAEPSSEQFQQFEFQLIDNCYVVHLHDESVLSSEAIANTKRELFELLNATKPERVVVNFASVQHCSSAAVSVLVQLQSKLKSSGTKLYLCGMRESIREVFRVLNLDGSVFEIRDTVTIALHSLK
jgi:anti-anti-sigma factor